MNFSCYSQYVSFDGYTAPEFLREFLTTLWELMLGIGQALSQIFSSVGPVKIMIGLYAILLLGAVASEINRQHKRRDAEHKAQKAELDAYLAEKARIQSEKDERLAGFAQRSAKKPAGKKLPASAHLTYQVQKNHSPGHGARGR